MNDLCKQVGQCFPSDPLLGQGSRLLVAVSGGVDSMTLLHVLHRMAPTRGWTLIAAHLNHQLRGRSSQADERFVKAQCRRLNVPCVTGRRSVRTHAKRRRLSVEMAARELRHRFLAQTARRRECVAIALAHHADDQTELVLMRLLRGAGSDGLGGMRPQAPSPVDTSVMLIRPFLAVERTRILSAALAARIPFREDRTNADLRILRNRVRHHLIPLLRERYQPALDPIVARTASVLSAEADCLRELARHWLCQGSAAFTDLPRALQRRVVQLQAIDCGVPIDYDTCEALVDQADRTTSAPGGEMLRRDADGRVSLVKPATLRHRPEQRRIELGIRGSVTFAGRTFRWHVGTVPRAASGAGRGRHSESFDAAAVGDEIVLRHWRAGDRFQPIGMGRAVKLQDLFTNLKVPVSERRKRVIAEATTGEILWVEGLRIGERFKLTPTTRKRLVWRWTC